MNYTKQSIKLVDKRWEESKTTSFYVANAMYENKVVEVTKTDFSICYSNDSQNISAYMSQQLFSESKSDNYIKVIELGDNYVVYEVMYFDSYNECFQSIKYLAVVDTLHCEMFEAYIN